MDATPETWLPVVGYDGRYEVSDHGNVRSLDRRVRCKGNGWRSVKGVNLKLAKKRNGYFAVVLGMKEKLVHHLVCEAFGGPRPEGYFCCHNDGNPANNHISNLRWDTPKANSADRVRHGNARSVPASTHCVNGHEYAVVGMSPCGPGRNGRCAECNRIYLRKYRTRAREAKRNAAKDGQI